LAIKEGVKKFENYLFGQRFTLITDNKPLISIFSPDKRIPPLSATRLQHYAIYLSAFRYDIIYRKSEDHGNVDALSRLPRKSEELQDMASSKDQVEVMFMEQMELLPINAQVISEATIKDPVLGKLWRILKGKEKTSEHTFMKIDLIEFSIINECITRGNRIVIPSQLRSRILKELHQGHFGIVKMKSLAREHVWWPGLDAEIESTTKKCAICLSNSRNPPKADVHYWEYPKEPWERVHADYMGPIKGVYYLIVVCAYTKWVEVFPVKSTTSKVTISKLSETFSRFGYPKFLVTDNGTQFKSYQFKSYTQACGIIQKFSAPYHPATNGQAERFVQMVKNGLMKCVETPGGEAELKLHEFLLRLRNQRSEATMTSPAKLMFKRPLRDKLYILHEKSPSEVQQYAHPKIKQGDTVIVRVYNSQKKWALAKIIKPLGPRNFEVQMGNRIIKRHLNQIRKISSEFEQPFSNSFSQFLMFSESPGVSVQGNKPPEEGNDQGHIPDADERSEESNSSFSFHSVQSDQSSESAQPLSDQDSSAPPSIETQSTVSLQLDTTPPLPSTPEIMEPVINQQDVHGSGGSSIRGRSRRGRQWKPPAWHADYVPTKVQKKH
jgi:hypothetical protein